MIGFKEFIAEQRLNEDKLPELSATNLRDNPDRLDTMIDFIENGKEFYINQTTKDSDGKEIINQVPVILLNNTKNIDTVKSILKGKSGTRYFFDAQDGQSYSLTQLVKTKDFGSNKSLNSEGKKLADAGERATVVSLTKDIITPEDTNEDIFINSLSAFNKWQRTFDETKIAVQKILKSNINSYDIVHDATGGQKINKIISTFCSKVKINKDAWNPADIWVIKKSSANEVYDRLSTIAEKDLDNKTLKLMFNTEIFNLYKEDKFYPISLKQLSKNGARTEFNNEPGKKSLPSYNVALKPGSFTQLNLTLDTREIGVFNIFNEGNGKTITFQNKGYPIGSNSTQVEITNDGSDSGGRLGKCSSTIIEEVYEDYGEKKIVPSKVFGSAFEKVTKHDISLWAHWYETVKKSNLIKGKGVKPDLNKSQIMDYMKNTMDTLTDTIDIKVFKHKIQGLHMQYFLCTKTKDEVNDIITRYIYGAKKISLDGCFFIKIY